MKLLNIHSGVAGVYFPAGIDGTCENATKKCLKHCTALECEKSGKDTINTKDILYSFMTEPIYKLTEQIELELKELKTNIIFWFASGDCPEYFESKFYEIIKDSNWVNLIFTRNEHLWRKLTYLKSNKIIIIYSLDDIDELKKLSNSGRIAIPDYKTGNMRLYYLDYSRDCSGSKYDMKERNIKNMEINEDECQNCYKKDIGCFYQIDF